MMTPTIEMALLADSSDPLLYYLVRVLVLDDGRLARVDPSFSASGHLLRNVFLPDGLRNRLSFGFLAEEFAVGFSSYCKGICCEKYLLTGDTSALGEAALNYQESAERRGRIHEFYGVHVEEAFSIACYYEGPNSQYMQFSCSNEASVAHLAKAVQISAVSYAGRCSASQILSSDSSGQWIGTKQDWEVH